MAKKILKKRQSHDPEYYRHLRQIETEAGTVKARYRILKTDRAEVERLLAPYVERADFSIPHNLSEEQVHPGDGGGDGPGRLNRQKQLKRVRRMKFFNFFRSKSAISLTDDDLVAMWRAMALHNKGCMDRDPGFSSSAEAVALKTVMLKVRFMALARGVEVDSDWCPPAFVFPEGRRDIPELDEFVTERD